MPLLATCWDAAAQLSTQFDPTKATGALLAGLVQLNGIQKKHGTFTQIVIQLNGVGVLSAGSLIADTLAAVIFSTNDAISVNGTGFVNATCTVEGPTSPHPGSIYNILTPPSSGSLTAQNTSIVVVGTDEESDTALRTRQQTETTNTGYRQIDSIVAGIIAVDGVLFAKAFQNRSATDTDANGLPPKNRSAWVISATPHTTTPIFKAFTNPSHGSGPSLSR
jgi:uncharacterized phage protein gp47/JayE